MPENTIFNPQSVNQEMPASAGMPPVTPATSSISTPQAPSMPPLQQPSVVTTGPVQSPPPPPSSLIGKLVKIGGLLLVIVLLVFLGVRFILPMFGPKEPIPVTITYWGLWEDEKVMQGVFADFKRQYPHITVEYVRQDSKKYRERLTTRIGNNTGPDIFRFHNTWYPMFADTLLPLPSDVITPDEFKKVYYPVIQQDLVRNGAIYGIPTGIDTLSLYVNTEILDAAGLQVPVTWEEFLDAAKLTTVKPEGKIKTAGAALGTFDNVTHAPDIISLLFAQSNVNIYGLGEQTKTAGETLDFYTKFARPPSNVWDDTLDPSIIAFAKGNLAMYFGYSWDIYTLQALNAQLQYTIHPVPSLFGKRVTIANYWPLGVSSKSTHQQEALLLMKFLAQKQQQQKIYTEVSKTRLFGELYARKDLAETLKGNALIQPFIIQAPEAVSSFFVADTYDDGMNAQMNAYLGNAVRAMLNGTSGESAAETLAEGVTQVLQQYGQ